MRDKTTVSRLRSTACLGFTGDERPLAGCWGFALLAGGWAGMILAHVVGGASDDPTSGRAFLATAAIALTSLGVIGGGAAIAGVAAQSPLRHVFRSGPSFWTALGLSAVGTVAAASLIVRHAFERFASRGQLVAESVADLGCAAASFVCLFAGLATSVEGWSARVDERSWGRPRRP